MKKIHLFITSLIILTSCQGFSDAGKVLRNEKIKTTDEFLVKKKGPLVLPPNYEEIPAPDTMINKDQNQEDKIKKILKAPKKQKQNSNNSSSIETSIIEKIRK